MAERTAPAVIAFRRRRMPEELADLLYVTRGVSASFGIDSRPIFDEVHQPNLAKVGGPTRFDGKILKPNEWTPSAIEPLLARMR